MRVYAPRLLPLLLLALAAVARCQPHYNLITPGVLRVESEEVVIVEAHGLDGPVEVVITVQDFPQKKRVLNSTKVSMNTVTSYMHTAKIKIPAEQIKKDSKTNQYVYVVATFNDVKVEKEVLVAINSGYLFIQTDKTIYTPGSRVLYRVFATGHNLEPVFQAVTVELVTPDGVVVEKSLLSSKDQIGIYSKTYTIPDIVNLGFWKIIAKYENSPHETYSTEFEVKEYVLPSFEVKIAVRQKFYHLEDNELNIDVTARYLHGKPVQGSAYILFGALVNNEKKSIPGSLDKIQITDGEGSARLTKEMLRSRFPNYNELLDQFLYVTVNVLTSTGSEMVEAEKTGIPIVNSPFKMAFTKTPQYFKPGLIYSCVVQCHKVTTLGLVGPLFQPSGCVYIYSRGRNKGSLISSLWIVSVMNPDGSPAAHIPIKTEDPAGYSGITQVDGTATLNLNTPQDTTQFSITVKTAKEHLPEDRQASLSMGAVAYKGHGIFKNYLHIGVPSTELKPEDNLRVTFYIRNENLDMQNQIQYFSYLILNKGKIVKAGRQRRESGQSLTTMSLPLTVDFIPSFRLVAYYHLQNGAQKEIVADAVWIDMQDTCLGTLKVTGVPDLPNKVYEPGKAIRMKVTGDVGAKVGLVAVDKAVFVLNKRNKLSQNKVWDIVEKNDVGCTPGSGSNNAGVFTDAGLSFQSTLERGNTVPRTDVRCPHAMRRRRSAMSPRAKVAKAQQYQNLLARRCCEDGMQENPMGYTCDKRATYILDGIECTNAFLDCCKHVFERPTKQLLFEMMHRRHGNKGNLTLARTTGGASLIFEETVYSNTINVRPAPPPAPEEPEDQEYVTDEEIVSRSQFEESWLWQMVDLPEEGRDGVSSADVDKHLQDSITTWEVLAIGFSKAKGICVADPYEITVRKAFFIDLRLPYSVVRNEQVEIRAVIHNYAPLSLTVKVELIYNEAICSSSTRENRFQQIIEILPESTHVIPYVIVPLKAEELEIEVKAAVSGHSLADGVRKKLRVVPEGMKILQNIKSVILDPSSSGAVNGIQEIKVEPMSLLNVVPNTHPVTFISVKGDIVGETVENSIDGANLKHLITVPVGCGEQNMITMTPAVIATHYLDKTDQWARLGVERRADAINFIKQGYTQQLAYRKEDGSYAAFTNRPSSTWLTAYVVKVFAMANNLISIERTILCGAIKWLILEKQKPDGLFQEDAPVIHGEMVGGSQSSEPEVSLTAFVLVALAEAKDICSSTVPSLETSIEKAATFLENRVDGLKKVYSIAISSYALALVGKSKGSNKLIEKSTGADSRRSFVPLTNFICVSPTEINRTYADEIDGTHWHDPTSKLYTIEATSYGLLDLLQRRKFDSAAPVVQWLTEQRYYGGGYGSTQSTIMVFQALSKYQAEKPSSNDIDMEVSLSFPKRTNRIRWSINTNTAMVSKTERTTLNEGFTATATGQGQGTLTVMTSYYAPLADKSTSCKKFDFSITMENAPAAKKPDGAISSVLLTICMRYLGATDSTMTILDVAMLTGFTPDMDDLDKLTNRVDKYISKYEMDTERSDRGSLIIYLDKVSNSENECIKFKAHQNFEVGLIQPAAVTIYEYYSLENSCTKFYHPSKESGLLKTICKADACRCVAEKCSLTNKYKLPMSDSARINAACEPGVDYVYMVELMSVEENGMYDFFSMMIAQVIKEGSDLTLRGNIRRFISHRACRDSLQFNVGSKYLIWGPSTDLWDLKTEMTYLIGSNTWVEAVPAECGVDAFPVPPTCTDLQNFITELITQGCTS